MSNSDELGQIITYQGERIMELEDVVGIGEGLCDGKPCIRVFLARDNAASVVVINELLTGIRYEIDVSGEFSATQE